MSSAKPPAAKAPRRKRNSITLTVAQECPKSLEIRKPAELIFMRNRQQSPISLLQRRSINGLLAYAQNTGDKESYTIPIQQFEALIGNADSSNRPYLKRAAQSLMQIQAEFNYRGDTKVKVVEHEEIRDSESHAGWGIANVIAELYFSPDGHELNFSLPSQAKKHLLNPHRFKLGNTEELNEFSSYAGLTLYEIVDLYATSPSQRTHAMHWREWSMILSGSASPHSTYREFSKMLTRAVQQVCAYTEKHKGYIILPTVTKKNRCTDLLWFGFSRPEQSVLPLQGSCRSIDSEIKRRLATLGFSDEEIHQLHLDYDEDYLLAQLVYTENRLNNKSGEPITHVKSYFKGALDRNYANAPRQAANPISPAEAAALKAKKDQEEKAKKTKALMDEIMAYRRNQLLQAKFHDLDDAGQQALLEEFAEPLAKKNMAILNKAIRTQGLKSQLVRSTLMDLICERYLTEPTVDEVLEYAINKSIA